MFRVLQNQTNNSKIIFSRNDITCTSIPFLNLSRFSIFPPVQKQRVFARHNLFAFLAATPNEKVEKGQLYLDNIDNKRIIAPVRWPVDIRRFLTGPDEVKLTGKLKSGEWIPSEMPYDFKIEGIKIRKKEVGMFVDFTFRADEYQKEKALEEIIQKVQTFLEDKRDGLWFDINAHLVKGEPFIEDLIDRYPVSRLRIEFQGPDVLTETLYKCFEPYGSIRDINLFPASSKDFSRYALIQYSKLRSAISAKNCVHGINLNGTRLNILYDHPARMQRIYKWIINHPTLSTISLPLIPFIAAAAVVGITYGLDLICYFFIRSRITHNHLYQRFSEKTANLFTFYRQKPKEETFSFSTKEQEDRLLNWLKEPPENFIVLLGPTSSGKSALVNNIIREKGNVVSIKCDEILDCEDENERALELARQVGCSPIFNLVISFSKLGNLLANDVIGHKIFGFPSTDDDPLKKVLDLIGNALHRSKKNQTEEFPIVVIDAYMIKYKENHELWELLVKFATQLVEKKLSHVVFVSSNIGITNHLENQAPSMPMKVLDLHEPDAVVNLVDKYARDKNLEIHEGLRDAIKNIGMHLSDLGLFIGKVRSGEKPDDALNNLINEAKADVYKLAFHDDTEHATTKEWSDIQSWEIIKKLSKKEYIFYDIVKSSPIFNDDDTPIKAMERAGLISISKLPQEYSVAIIKPGRPLYQKIFAEISSDELFEIKMKYKTAQYYLSLENNRIKEYENELEKLVKIDSKWNNKWSSKWSFRWLLGNGHEIIDHRVKFLLIQLKKSLARAKMHQKQIDELKQNYELILKRKAVK